MLQVYSLLIDQIKQREQLCFQQPSLTILFEPLFKSLVLSTFSRSVVADLNSLIPRPKDLPNSGNFPGPKITTATTRRTTAVVGVRNPNVVSKLSASFHVEFKKNPFSHWHLIASILISKLYTWDTLNNRVLLQILLF